MPAPGHAQLRRESAVQTIVEAERGTYLVGLGARFGRDAWFPLSDLRGDLLVPARLTLAYAPAPGVLLQGRFDAYRLLLIEERGDPRIPLDPSVDGETTSDIGDFRLSAAAVPFGRREGWSLGGRFEVVLPNSDERRGIGTNTTDVLLTGIGSFGADGLRASAELGLGILEAPTETFEQNDVLVYGAELLLGPGGEAWRLALGVRGRSSTRDRVPLGTEDRGEVRLGAEWGLDDWRLDGDLGLGYAGTSPTWLVDLGVALTR